MGEGTFGKVIEAEYLRKSYAIKVLRSKNDNYEFSSEKKILEDLKRHDPNDQYGVVKLIEAFIFGDYSCFVFELLGKNLYDIIRTNNSGYSIKMVQSIFQQILLATSFIHSIGYTHTDFKPENIVFVSK